MSKFDSVFKKAILFERLACYLDSKSFLSALAQGVDTPEAEKQWSNLDNFGNPKQNGIPEVDPLVGGQSQNPDVAPVGTPVSTNIYGPPTPDKSKTSVYPNVDKSQQAALNRISMKEGLGIPLAEDGKLGPETKKVLDAFKKKFQLSSTLNDTEALEFAKLLADKTAKYQF